MGYARIGSLSQQTSVIDPSQIVSDYAKLSGAQPSQIVQSFEMNAGYALQLFTWRGNLTYFDHGSLSLFAGGGALTPLSPSQAPAQTYTVPVSANPPTTINYLDGKTYVAIPAANCDPASMSTHLCYLSVSPQDRSRFYSFYEGGFRAKLYASPQYLKSSPFPAMFDLAFGQNEYVTGGGLKGVVMHLGGSAPISPIPALYVFGGMDLGINNKSDKPINAILTPFNSPIPSDVSGGAYVKIQSPPNRDRYALGFGIDILQLLRTHQLQDAFSKSQSGTSPTK